MLSEATENNPAQIIDTAPQIIAELRDRNFQLEATVSKQQELINKLDRQINSRPVQSAPDEWIPTDSEHSVSSYTSARPHTTDKEPTMRRRVQVQEIQALKMTNHFNPLQLINRFNPRTALQLTATLQLTKAIPFFSEKLWPPGQQAKVDVEFQRFRPSEPDSKDDPSGKEDDAVAGVLLALRRKWSAAPTSTADPTVLAGFVPVVKGSRKRAREDDDSQEPVQYLSALRCGRDQ